MTTKKKIAIVGFTPHREKAPFENPDWEIWPINDLYMDLPILPYERWTWFQLHEWQQGRPVESPTDFSAGPHHPRDPNHVPWLREVSKKMKVYVRPEAKEFLPDAVVFPYDEIHDAFPRKYFTNSVSYMMALALYQGCEQLGVYGIDMMVSDGSGNAEYGYQRPSCEYFVGIADERLGKENVDIPRESDLCKAAFLYGTEHSNDWRTGIEKEKAALQAKVQQLEIQQKTTNNAIHEMIGTSNGYDRMLRCHTPGDGGEWGAMAPREQGNMVYQKTEVERITGQKVGPK